MGKKKKDIIKKAFVSKSGTGVSTAIPAVENKNGYCHDERCRYIFQ